MDIEKTKNFIARAKEVHGNKYDYSKVDYITTHIKVCIICPEHGDFWQTPKNHLHNHGCPKCGRDRTTEAQSNTLEEFVRQAKEVHGDKYDYSKSVYVNNHVKVCITCPEHGDFWQTPANHVKNHGCPKCGGREQLTQEAFLQKAKEVHGDKYDYSKAIYGTHKTALTIICPKHGEFKQIAHYHLSGHGCPQCANESRSEKTRMVEGEFLNRAEMVHQGKYDYSKTKFLGYNKTVTITCPIHGDFEQVAGYHINGSGCPKCAVESTKSKLSSNAKLFIEKARIIHGNKYDYSEVEYLNNKTKVRIGCSKHGFFLQNPNNHLLGEGCPICSDSRSEIDIYEYVCSLVGRENVIHRDRSVLKNREIDIYVPSLRIGIEYNGLHWHSDATKSKTYHLEKLEECLRNGVYLVQIFEDEYLEHKDIVFAKLRHILGRDFDKPKAMGRKCEIHELNKSVAEAFLNQYHIQGFSLSTVYLGAYYCDVLIGVMTFKQETKGSNKWELTRFATNDEFACQGVGGKLFKYFVRTYSPEKIKSFADRRWTLNMDSNLYIRLGFKIGDVLNPDYRYVVGKERQHKFGFRKKILAKKYGFRMDMTEREMTNELGFDRIYDCGLIRYEWVSDRP